MKPAEVTQKISEQLSSMRKSERKVAEYILANPGEIIHMRIVDLATEAQVSEPTVVRFCRAVGCSGFQEFKLNLAQQLASSPSFGQIAVTETDSIAEYKRKVFDSTVDTLLNVRDKIDGRALEAAISAIAAAKRVEFFGFGASGAVAADAQHKFFRLQMATAAHSDHHMQSMSAMSMQPGDVVVAISQSGRTSSLLRSMEMAKQQGATVIGLGPSGSPMTRQSSIPLEVDVEEDIELYTPLSSRIAHLVVIDVLAIGVAQRKGPQLQEHLLKLKQGLYNLREEKH
ncbi:MULTISPECIES: transcriptional regulator HexR [Microbulbifer]|uniref:MurR/RpiR family transcriptional regulator n=2 Tax=Microbulbifer agarilyticus TaxID=260552 RepID=A0A1Q2M915_9GAMM|nr:transcriptional regulator HexR [Microbulbifer agarilyticus]AQQ69233.1 MurR/RpiR family transcriptional regulator [Microbulbifer agarilyticus]MBY6190878.1 transcriptional regulator HexR [Microbulbifer agarilyticus]MBY6211485.1 transcriptional regulator HexR [Microbulbifer agarilyticus]MCA0893497.1 transcriptional regulator HexR [Microbulbifer agarilyticus]MCA0900106.1 transcriptional regulator HexR [Microbulbifer agarilyticus]